MRNITITLSCESGWTVSEDHPSGGEDGDQWLKLLADRCQLYRRDSGTWALLVEWPRYVVA